MPAPLHPWTGLFSVKPGLVAATRRTRKIRSYVLREGRLTRGQARALEQYWPLFGLENTDEELDLNRVFGRPAPKILEIGTGMGEGIIALAGSHPENDYLAVEVHRPGIGSLLRLAAEQRLTNIRVINRDVVEVLGRQIPDRSLDEVYLFFPDPWPKKRHHKRRLLNNAFLSLLYTRLKSHARLYLATDRQDLAHYLRETCDEHPRFTNLAGRGNFAPRPVWRPLTKFEQRGTTLKQTARDLVYCVSG